VSFDWLLVFIRGNDLWENISEGTKKSVMKKLKALEELGQRNDAPAAVAAEMMAYFQLKIIGDFGAAAKSFQRLVTLAPQNQTAWDMLTICWGMADKDEQSITVCKERLKQKDSAHNHFMLARCNERIGHFDQAEEEVRFGLRLEPEDFLANLSLACLLMRRGENPKALEEAGSLLDKVHTTVSEKSPPDKKSNYASARGLYLVLTGNTEEGRKQFQESLKIDPENGQANEALEILGQ
jgi:tetratricopeptide (TPR) repeat protein